MEEVKLELDEHHRGHFFIEENGEGVAAMQIGILENTLTVYHTEVLPEYEGKGLSKELLNAMADYARKNKLQVVPFCPYVLAQFKRHPDQYSDIMKK